MSERKTKRAARIAAGLRETAIELIELTERLESDPLKALEKSSYDLADDLGSIAEDITSLADTASSAIHDEPLL